MHEPDPRVPADAALADRLVPGAPRPPAPQREVEDIPIDLMSPSTSRSARPAGAGGRRRGRPPDRVDVALAFEAVGGGRRALRPARGRDDRHAGRVRHPRTGTPASRSTPGCDDIPARGLPPQSCAFRDRHFALEGLGATVVGVSAMDWPSSTRSPSASSLPYPSLFDGPLLLRDQIDSPTFDVWGTTLYNASPSSPAPAGSTRSSIRCSPRTATRPRWRAGSARALLEVRQGPSGRRL